MKLRDAAINAVVIVGLLFASAIVLGQLLGRPVLVGYVTTSSMQPTLNPGDGFVALPLFVEGAIQQGDVVVFHAETLHGGGLTTHRVVGETANGFITRGDANPVTDQASGEPPVTRRQIVATVLQVNGQVVRIPYLGAVTGGIAGLLTGLQRQLAVVFGTRSFLGTQGLAYILFGVGVVSYVLSSVRESQARYSARTRVRESGILDARVAIFVLTVLLVLVLTLSMTLPSGTHSFTYVSSESNAPGTSVLLHGTSETMTYMVPSNGVIPTVTYLESASPGLEVDPNRLYVSTNAHANATVTLHAPDDIGPVTQRLSEHRYLALLPLGVIDTLYRIHPWLPILAIDCFAAVGFAAFGAALVGWGPVRLDSPHEHSLTTRLRRWLK